jgi:hypothetical protein
MEGLAVSARNARNNMDIDRWDQIKENIKKRFDVVSETTEDLIVHTQEGEIKNGTADVLVVETPMGRMKLAFESRPVVLDKKFIYSHRGGTAARTEYEFSDKEFTHKLKAYKWDDLDEDWKEIDASSFAS